MLSLNLKGSSAPLKECIEVLGKALECSELLLICTDKETNMIGSQKS